jgi:hypothetical protein
MRILFLSFIFILNSCISSRQAATTQTLTFSSHFASFTIDTPIDWKKIKVQGVDSYIGRIAIGANDTIEFDLGYYSNNLTEHEPDDFDGDDYSRYAKSKVSWSTINKYNAKIVTPKKFGIGISGIYIDSLWKEGYDKVKFNLFGENLTKTNQKIFFKAIKTLRFSKLN